MNKFWDYVHLTRALSWIPITTTVFVLGWYKNTNTLVIVTLLYSAYANIESGFATYQGRRAQRQIYDQDKNK